MLGFAGETELDLRFRLFNSPSDVLALFSMDGLGR